MHENSHLTVLDERLNPVHEPEHAVTAHEHHADDGYVPSPGLHQRIMQHFGVVGSGLPVVNLSSRSGSDAPTVTPFRIQEMTVPDWAIRSPQQLHLQDSLRDGTVQTGIPVRFLVYARQQAEALLKGQHLRDGDHEGHAPTLSVKHELGGHGILATGRDFSLRIHGVLCHVEARGDGDTATLTIDTKDSPFDPDLPEQKITLVIRRDRTVRPD